MEHACFTCSNLMGCPLLADKKGVFVEAAVLKKEDNESCINWQPVNRRQKDVRDALYGIQGEGCLRVLHQVPSMIMEQLVKEGADEMNLAEMPDLTGMIREGMTTVEREEQLRYETNDEGEVLYDELDSGLTKRPRPQYQLRKFACDPDGHIRLDHSVGIFWNTEQVIRHILAVEVEQGLIVKPGKTKSKTAEKAKATETNMPKEGRRVLVNRGGKGKGPKPMGAPARQETDEPPQTPPTRKAAKGRAKPAQAAAPRAEPDDGGNGSVPDGAPFDVEAFLGDLQMAIGETVARAVEEAKNEILAAIGTAEGRSVDAVTMLQDRIALTAGTMQFEIEGDLYAVPTMMDTEEKIFTKCEGLDP